VSGVRCRLGKGEMVKVASTMRALGVGKNFALGFAVFTVMASACSDDDSGDGGGKGGNSGSSGTAMSGGTSGGKSTGGTSGTRTTGGTGASGDAGEGGDAGKSGEAGTGGRGDGGRDSVGGMGGEAVGGAGGVPDREPTAEEICRIYCPLDEYHTVREIRAYCSIIAGEASIVGEVPPYDQEQCERECLVDSYANVSAACGEEAMLYWSCLLDWDIWTCLDWGGATATLCEPVRLQLGNCILANPPGRSAGSTR
jgi:hypothetical protein